MKFKVLFFEKVNSFFLINKIYSIFSLNIRYLMMSLDCLTKKN